MPCLERPPRLRRASLRAALLVGAALCSHAAIADEPPATPVAGNRHRIIPSLKIDRGAGSAATSSGGWWLGTAGLALALAAFGGISVAARRFVPKGETGPLRVVGRTSLSPKHKVYLLKAGDKILIVGTGPQGSPTLLGEMPQAPADGRGAVPASVVQLRVGGET